MRTAVCIHRAGFGLAVVPVVAVVVVVVVVAVVAVVAVVEAGSTGLREANMLSVILFVLASCFVSSFLVNSLNKTKTLVV